MSNKVDHSDMNSIVDENFINIPELWPQLASSLVNSICNGPGQYIPVPRLRSRNEAYLPLQVFPDATSLMTGSVLRLNESQERVLTRDASQTSLVKKVQKTLQLGLKLTRRNQGNASVEDSTKTCKVHLKEEYRGHNDGIGFTLDQRIRRWRSPHPTDLDDDHGVRIRQDGWFRLKFVGIHYRSIQPHTLLDCRLPPASPMLRMGVKKFYVIYDTCMAREIQCILRCATNSDGRATEFADSDKERVVRLQNCPIAFRCVQATVDNNGVIVDLRFHVGEREVLCFDSKVKHTILSPHMLINMKVPS